jgi:prepilin-type N-terminal cleavage/methylation domain-containing protein
MNVRTRGFTLIELLIVTVIIGILAAIAIPKFSAVREKAFVAAMKSDLKNLATQQEIYHNAQFSFSTSLTILQMVQSDGIAISINEANGDRMGRHRCSCWPERRAVRPLLRCREPNEREPWCCRGCRGLYVLAGRKLSLLRTDRRSTLHISL